MLGLDVSRHQPSAAINWAVWKRTVGFIWVKGTDGTGRAPVEWADRKVRDAKAAGIPVGLYGYAQLGSPEAQADALYEECVRLNAFGIMPALDLEDPHPATAASRPFAVRFLQRLKARGITRPVLYGNKSMLNAINAESIRTEVSGTIIWLAEYGANNGTRRPQTYRGHVDVHQYTSVGRLLGYSGDLDLNESFNNLIFANAVEDDVELTDQMRPFIWPHNETVQDTVGSTLANTQSYAADLAKNKVPTIIEKLDDISERLTALEARPSADVDEGALAAELEARGIGGVTASQMVDILNTVRFGGTTPPDEA